MVRYRSGVTSDGELVAQEIEVIMDGGAYCTLTPVVLSRGTLHAGGPYRCDNVRIVGRAMATNTPPNGAFRGFGAPQTEFAAEMQVNRIAEALGESPLELRRRWVYVEGDTTPTGQVLRESVGGSAVLEAAAEASAFDTHRQRTQEAREMRGSGARRASGIGLALAWHGAGFTGSGEVKLASVASVELTDDHRIRILTVDRDGPGHEDDLPAAGGRHARRRVRRGRDRAAGHIDRAGFRPDRRQPDGHGGRRAADPRRRAAAREGRGEGGRSFADSYREASPRRVDEQFTPYPGVTFDDTTYTGDAYPAFGWAAAVAQVEVDLDTAEVTVREYVSADDIGRVIHPVLAEGQVESGSLQAIGYATIEEMKLVDGRYLNDRLATYLIPTSLDAPHPQHPGREALFRRSPRRQGSRRAADGRRGAGGGGRHPRRDRHLDPRPARHAEADSGLPDQGTDASAAGCLPGAARAEAPPIEDLPAGGDEIPLRSPTDPPQDFIP